MALKYNENDNQRCKLPVIHTKKHTCIYKHGVRPLKCSHKRTSLKYEIKHFIQYLVHAVVSPLINVSLAI